MRSIFRSSGTFQVVKATTSRVMQPPKTTEGTRPRSLVVDERLAPAGRQQHEAQREGAAEGEGDGEHAEGRHADQELAARPAQGRQVGQGEAHEHGADGGCGAQGAQSLGARLQDLFGEDGQHRHGAAEQHGEEVEADGAQEEALGEHEAQPLAQAREDGAFPGPHRLGRVADGQQPREAGQQKPILVSIGDGTAKMETRQVEPAA